MNITDIARFLFVAGAVIASAASFGNEACVRENFDLPRAEFAKYYPRTVENFRKVLREVEALKD